jgi:large conductance mechanosensitive channel
MRSAKGAQGGLSVKEILVGFKTFLMRGNLIELAIAFVLGVAFANVVDSLVTNLITPIIAMIFGKPSLSDLNFTINDATFFYGAFLDDLITFVTIAAAVYFFIVVPYEQIMARMKRGEAEPEATTKICPECMRTVPKEARRCACCTTQIA